MTVVAANITVPSGNVVANTTSETTFADGWFHEQNGFTTGVGQVYRVKGWGFCSSKASSPGTLTLRIKWGSTTIGSAVLTLTASASNAGFMVDAVLVICAVGSSGKVNCQGMVIPDSTLGSNTGIVTTGTGTSGQTTVNTQSQVSVGISAQFSVADVGNTITLSQLVIEEA
jgi:hypothetical protein